MRFKEAKASFKDFYLREGYSPKTVKGMAAALNPLFRFLSSKGISTLDKLSPEVATEYQISLLDLNPILRRHRIRALKKLGDFLLKKGVIKKHPGLGIKTTPKDTYSSSEPLTKQEIQAILDSCDLLTRIGIRDHALFITLWEGCLSIPEASKLTVDCIKNDLLLIPGKAVSRAVTLSSEAVSSLTRYIESARTHFRGTFDDGVLFLCAAGRVIDGPAWNSIIGGYLKKLNIMKKVSLQGFRWARIKALFEEGVEKEELRALAGNSFGFDEFLRRIS